MNLFTNMKVGLKLGVLILIAFVSLGAVGGIGYYYLQHSSQVMNAMYKERLVPITVLSEIRSNANAINGAVLELMLTTNTSKKQELRNFIADRAAKNNEHMAVIEKLHLDEKAQELLAKIKALQQTNRDTRTRIIDFAMKNANSDAYVLYTNSLLPLTNEYTDNLRYMAEYYSNLSDQMNEDTQTAETKAMLIIVGILAGSLLLLGVSGLVIGRMITKPLQLMVSACQEMADGDFRNRPRQFLGADEIGQVDIALVSMRDSIRSILKQVQEASEQVAASSEELTASADQSAQAVTQVASSISDISQGAEKNLSAVEETAAIVEQISSGIQQAAADTNQAAGNSLQAAEKAREGEATVEKAVNQMKRIEQTVSNSAHVVAKLGDRSKEIGQIIDAISGIAGQTNLLALNAAIEAARAGEQGRGFAVVAEEVRKLAEQSQDAAKQIAALISEIQQDTDLAVVAMSEGNREVKGGTEVVTLAGQAFKDITQLVMRTAEQVKGSSAAMQQIANGSRRVVGSVKIIDELSREAVGQAQNVSAATEEQSASMEQIAASSQGLAKMAQNLQTAVSRFQI